MGNLACGNGHIKLISSSSMIAIFLVLSTSYRFISILHGENQLFRLISFLTPDVFFRVLESISLALYKKLQADIGS